MPVLVVVCYHLIVLIWSRCGSVVEPIGLIWLNIIFLSKENECWQFHQAITIYLIQIIKYFKYRGSGFQSSCLIARFIFLFIQTGISCTKNSYTKINCNIFMIKHPYSQHHNSSSKQSQYYDWLHPKTEIKPVFKYTTSFIMLSLLILYRIFWIEIPTSSCIMDQLHGITLFVNKSLSQGRLWMIGLIQIIIDSSVCFIMLYWVWKMSNSRMPTSVALTFALRSIFIEMDKFPFPENFVWESPGFPSLFVPYGRTRDFYFSGHTTTVFLIFLQLFYTKAHKAIIIVSGINCLIVIFSLITLQVHYTIDCIGGIIFSGFIYMFVNRFLGFFDHLWGLPFSIIRKTMRKCKKNKMQEEDDLRENEIDEQFYSYTQQKNADGQRLSNKSDWKSQQYGR